MELEKLTEGLGPQASAFMQDLHTLCLSHGVGLCTSGYDGLILYPMPEDPRHIVHVNGIEDQIGEAVRPGRVCARLESEARIIGRKLVISLDVSTLATAARNSDYFFNAHEGGADLSIVDEAEFAKSVTHALNLEEEDGSTPITRMLDEAFEWVCEQGEPGVEG